MLKKLIALLLFSVPIVLASEIDLSEEERYALCPDDGGARIVSERKSIIYCDSDMSLEINRKFILKNDKNNIYYLDIAHTVDKRFFINEKRIKSVEEEGKLCNPINREEVSKITGDTYFFYDKVYDKDPYCYKIVRVDYKDNNPIITPENKKYIFKANKKMLKIIDKIIEQQKL